MNNELMEKQYRLIESWKLFVEEGIYKTDGLYDAEIKLWQQSKLLGAKYFLEEIHLDSMTELVSELEFDQELNLWSIENSVSVFLFNPDRVLLSKSSFSFDNFSLEKGAILDDRSIGINALTLSVKSGEYRCLKGAQHYVKALQYYIMRSYPVRILEKDYFFVSINHISNETDKSKAQIAAAIQDYINRISGNIEKKQDIARHFEAGIYEISSTGRVKYTEYSNLSVVSDGENILSVFYNCSLVNLFKGNKELVFYKNKKEKKYLITPISKKNQFSCTILIENYQKNLDFFQPFFRLLNRNYSNFVHLNKVSAEFLKRLKALANSSMPVIFILDKISDQLLFSSYINTLRIDSRDYYINLDPSKNLTKNFEENISTFENWIDSGKNIAMHIFNLSLIEKEKASKTINTCFYSSYKDFKYFFYLNKNYYEELLARYPNLMGSFKLNVLEVSPHFIQEILNSFNNEYRIASTKELEKVEPSPSRKIYSLKELEKNAILDALLATDYNVSKATKLLEISRSTLYRKIKEYNIKI